MWLGMVVACSRIGSTVRMTWNLCDFYIGPAKLSPTQQRTTVILHPTSWSVNNSFELLLIAITSMFDDVIFSGLVTAISVLHIALYVVLQTSAYCICVEEEVCLVPVVSFQRLHKYITQYLFFLFFLLFTNPSSTGPWHHSSFFLLQHRPHWSYLSWPSRDWSQAIPSLRWLVRCYQSYYNYC